eukprot:837808-Amphidinium_carterae.1
MTKSRQEVGERPTTIFIWGTEGIGMYKLITNIIYHFMNGRVSCTAVVHPLAFAMCGSSPKAWPHRIYSKHGSRAVLLNLVPCYIVYAT